MKLFYLCGLWVILFLPMISFAQDKDTAFKTACYTGIDTLDGQTVYKQADKMPLFPGGDDKLFEFLGTNLKYPTMDNEKESVQGAIYISFIIDTTGAARNACIYNRKNKYEYTRLDKEGLRVVTLLPKFIPGEINGKKVCVRYILPIRFKN